MTEAESNIQSVLESLGLKHVVQVDDANVAGISLERVLEAGGGFLDWAEWGKHGVTPIDAPFDDNWRAQVTTHWNTLGDDEKLTFATSVLESSGDLDDSNDAADKSFQTAIKSLFTGASFEALSLGDWQDRYDAILARAQDEPTLVLFDLHFERESRQPRYGVELLKQHKDHEHLTLGLLSHEPEVAEEPRLWMDISTETQVPPDRFVVLSKKRLTEDEPALLVDGLRRTVLAKAVGQVRSTCESILGESVDEATKAVNKINVYDFDQAIFRSSRIEGVWEGDTFFRLFNAAVRQYAQRAMHGWTELRTHITEIRQKFPIRPAVDAHVERRAWRLHRQEMYEDAEFVNCHCLPISNGDIYRVAGVNGGKDRFLVLVGQPCDLAVRPDGKRVFDKDLSRMGFWLEATSVGPDDKLGSADFSLPYFLADNPQPWRLRLGRLHYVSLVSLDLCAINSDGQAKLPLDKAFDEPLLLPGWNTRVELIQKAMKKLISVLPSDVALDEGVQRSLIEGLLPRACHSLKLGVTLEGAEPDRILKLGICRVGRIAPEWSAAILGRVAAHLSRPAFEHDLAREDA